MEQIKKHFDDFTFHARVMPVLVESIPFLVVGAKGLIVSNALETGTMITLAIIVVSLLYRLARDRGKRCEDKMVERLGYKPTVLMLRFSDTHIGAVSKKEYHQRINKVFHLALPLEASDEKPEDDAQYEAAVRSLKNRANSDRSAEFRVYQELKEYHFFRNLYGIKPIAIGIYGVLAFREFFVVRNFSFVDLFLHPFPDYLTFLIFVTWILLNSFVTQKWVEERSYSYGKALIETCERLPNEFTDS